jgi:hypothetical protein
VVGGRRPDGVQQVTDEGDRHTPEPVTRARTALPEDPDRALSLLPAQSDDPQIDLPDGGIQACHELATALLGVEEPATAARYQWAAAVLVCDRADPYAAARVAAETVRTAARAARTDIAAAPDPTGPTAELLAIAAVTDAATSPDTRDWNLPEALKCRDWPTLRERVLAAVKAEAVTLRDA